MRVPEYEIGVVDEWHARQVLSLDIPSRTLTQEAIAHGFDIFRRHVEKQIGEQCSAKGDFGKPIYWQRQGDTPGTMNFHAIAPVLAPVAEIINILPRFPHNEFVYLCPERYSGEITMFTEYRVPLKDGRGYHHCERGCRVLVLRHGLPWRLGEWLRLKEQA